MKIGLDFDGVISNCAKLRSDYARQRFGVDVPGELFKRDIVLGNGWLTSDQYQEISRAIYYTKEVGLLMEPVDGVKAWVPKLIEEGHQISVITSRADAVLEIAKEWAKHQSLGLDLIGVGIGNSKAPAAAGLDVYVDDDLHKLKPLVGVVPHLFLFSWGYNRQICAAGVAVRVSSWTDLCQKIATLR
ncbi:MAG: hypothetical protein HY695_08885 [Deltaproteobacteria bacterium]|nr:hypothetical protein [Deltaproteobacteria bacterium]